MRRRSAPRAPIRLLPFRSQRLPSRENAKLLLRYSGADGKKPERSGRVNDAGDRRYQSQVVRLFTVMVTPEEAGFRLRSLGFQLRSHTVLSCSPRKRITTEIHFLASCDTLRGVECQHSSGAQHRSGSATECRCEDHAPDRLGHGMLVLMPWIAQRLPASCGTELPHVSVWLANFADAQAWLLPAALPGS